MHNDGIIWRFYFFPLCENLSFFFSFPKKGNRTINVYVKSHNNDNCRASSMQHTSETNRVMQIRVYTTLYPFSLVRDGCIVDIVLKSLDVLT